MRLDGLHEQTDTRPLPNDELVERSLQLEHQAVQLRRTNDELRQFAHVASHDLQEPLRTMGSYSSLMASTYSEVLDDEGRRWLGYINSGAKRLSELIREILQFSTVDQLQPDQQVDLNDLVDKALPAAIRLKTPTTIGQALAEHEALDRLKEIASKNKLCKNYIGMGYHPTRTPAVILRNILENPSWYTQVPLASISK